MPAKDANPEAARLREARAPNTPWKKWGPYLAERQWGTVREDYSQDGNAWDYFSHDQARSRAYHWGEDGLAGISDEKQLLCFGLALWNGRDPILKERLFGLTNREGNHGEDVKEYYFYLDSTPTHSYMKYLYKYPQAAFPYNDLIRINGQRDRTEMEYELLDTGVFNTDRYFDVFVEYAKNSPEDILIQISVCNRGPEPATLHVLPTLWFRNTWTWWPDTPKPALTRVSGSNGTSYGGGRARSAGRSLPLLRDGSSPAVHGERDQQRADLRHAQRRPVCQGRDQQLFDRRKAGCGQSGAHRHEGFGAPPTHRGCRKDRHDLATVERPGACRHGRAVRRPSSAKSCRSAGVRRTSSIGRSRRAGSARTRPA